MTANLKKTSLTTISVARSGGGSSTYYLEELATVRSQSLHMMEKPILQHGQSQTSSARHLPRNATYQMQMKLAPDLDQSTTASINNITFKPKAVHKLLKQLSPDKATGPDEIPARILREVLCVASSTFAFHKGYSQVSGRQPWLHPSIRGILNLTQQNTDQFLCSASSAKLWKQL